MKIVILQPPYPAAGTHAATADCLRWMREQLANLSPGQQDLVLLPEYANVPGINERQPLRDFAAGEGAEFVTEVATLAGRLACLVAMGVAEQSGGRWFNRTLLYGADGKRAFSYDKVHLTGSERCELGFTPGTTSPVFVHGQTRFGFATCFDLYFSEHFANLAFQQVDLVLCPSYQRSETPERIRLQAQARALDSGSYVLRSSYAMPEPDLGGRSLVAAPTGNLLADAGGHPAVLAVEVDVQHKFTKPASHGQPHVEHRTLIESNRRPRAYRPSIERAQCIGRSPFPRLCAHRGLSQSCPENTLPAMAAAIAVGAHEIEIDVRQSRDGVLVICHDPTVDRTTDGSGQVAEMDWAQLRSLDAGLYLGPAWRGVRMPTLEDILQLVDGRVGINIHVQNEAANERVIREICDQITEHAITDQAYIALGTEAALATAREYAPEIARACLVKQNEPEAAIAIAEQYGCQRIQFFRSVRADQLRQAKALGIICNLFWSDEPEDGLAYADMGIDVVLTNCVHTMIAGGFKALDGCRATER